MQMTRIGLAVLGALATSVAPSTQPTELPVALAPTAVPAGPALLAPDKPLDGAPLPYEYAYHPTLGWRRIVAPSVPYWAQLPNGAFSDLGPLGGTPVLEFGSASAAKSDDEDGVERHPVP